MSSHFRRVAAAIALLGGVTTSATAQATGSISGRALDQASQAPVQGATVLVVGTARGSQTAADGSYTIGGVAPGTVQVRTSRIGFQPSVRSATVSAGQTTMLDFALNGLDNLG